MTHYRYTLGLQNTNQTPGSSNQHFPHPKVYNTIFPKGPNHYDNQSSGHSPELGNDFEHSVIWRVAGRKS